MLRRAASLVEGKRLTLVKASSRRRHLLFDVPVIGPGTIDVMIETNTTALAVDAGRTLLLDREELLAKANAAKIAIVGMEPISEEATAMTRVAVIGAGSFGKNHVRVVRESARAELKFVVDADPARAREFAGDARPPVIIAMSSVQVDAAILAVPTVAACRNRLRAARSRYRCSRREADCPHARGSRPAGGRGRAQRPHSAGRASGALQPRRDCARARGDAAAVFRDPPNERLHAAQPRRGCRARLDDPRSRYRARSGARAS